MPAVNCVRRSLNICRNPFEAPRPAISPQPARRGHCACRPDRKSLKDSAMAPLRKPSADRLAPNFGSQSLSSQSKDDTSESPRQNREGAGTTEKSLTTERLAAALRENLRRRKVQRSGRSALASGSAGPANGGNDPREPVASEAIPPSDAIQSAPDLQKANLGEANHRKA